jgi:hypothetical protein
MPRLSSLGLLISLLICLPAKGGHFVIETTWMEDIAPVGEIRQVHSGFSFTEGPAPDAQGNLYFSDIPKNRIYQLSPSGELTVFLEKQPAMQRPDGG